MKFADHVLQQTGYFDVIELSKGIYAAIENEETTGSNAGIIDLGDKTIVFDTFLDRDAAMTLRQVAKEITGREPSVVINSHFHADHVVGNCVFPDDVVIISSEKARTLIGHDTRETFEELGKITKEEILELENQIVHEKDPTTVLNLKNQLKFIKGITKSGVELRVPDITFEKEIILYGRDRDLHLIAFEAGHSKGDVIAYLPDDKICFMGDLLFVDSHPWLGSGDPHQLTLHLKEILDYDIESFIGGHGQIGTEEDVRKTIQYIEEVIALVQQRIDKGELDKPISIKDISPLFEKWEGLCFPWNIEFLFEFLNNNK